MDAPTFRNIFALNTDGGREENLSQDNHSFAPALSPDGSRIAYVHIKAETCEGCLLQAEYELYVMNADGSDPHFLNDLEGPLSRIRWSPDSKFVSYCGWTRRDPQSSLLSGSPIFLNRLDGPASPLLLVQESVGDFEWSPDGKWVAHGCITQQSPKSPRSPRVGLCLTRVGEPGNPIRLSEGPITPYFSWSLDSTRILFIAGDFGSRSILVAGTDGSQPKALTRIDSVITRPHWSPDGTQIVFLDEDHRKAAVFTMNADGSNRQRLTEPKLRASDPVWSPDGKQIAFSGVVHDWLQVHLMNADGSGLRQVTHDKKSGCSDPSWLPNSRMLLLSCGYVKPDMDLVPKGATWHLSLLNVDDPAGLPRELAALIQGPISYASIPLAQSPANP